MKMKKVGQNAWNTEMIIESFNSKYNEKIKDFLDDTQGNDVTEYYVVPKDMKDAAVYIKKLYDDGYGLKVLARHIGITYSVIRRLFRLLCIDIRKGQSIVTNKVIEFRKMRVSGTSNPWKDWPKNMPDLAKKLSKGVTGWYKTKNGNEIYLRSSWEYIFAKWLDSKNMSWIYEGKQYKLSNGEGYRPDFSLLNPDGSLDRIIEIKGFFKNRLYKVDLMKNDYPDIKISVISNVSHFTKNYKEDLIAWKQMQLSRNAK